MSAATTKQQPPTLADIVREKTDDGRRIIDFFLDVMEDRVDGAQLCHRLTAARQLEKHQSGAAARFLAEYRGVSCGHAARRRPDPAAPCSDADATGQESAPPPFTQDFLTVLSAVDEDLMIRLIRAQTADGGTVIDFLYDVMQNRVDGFKPHHRLAAAKELIVHIVRDEQPEPAPDEPASAHPEPVEGPVLSPAGGSVRAEPVEAKPVVPAHPTVFPAKSLPRTGYGAGTHPVHHEPVPSTAEGSQLKTNNSKLKTPPARSPPLP